MNANRFILAPFLGAILCLATLPVHAQEKTPQVAGDNGAPKVLLFIRDEGSDQLEYMLVHEVGPMRKILTESGFDVTIASISGKAIKTNSITVTPDCELKRVKIDDYAGFILPCVANDSAPSESATFAREIVNKGKPIAAQVGAVHILGRAGVLNGKKFAFPEEKDFNASMYPAFKGGIYSGKGVVQDGVIITSGTCPMMAKLHGYQDCTAELTRTLIGVITARAVNPNVETMLAQNVPNGTNDAAIEFSSARTDRSPNLLPRAKAPARQTYVYKTVGDCKIYADVFRPADQQPRPVILWLHGGAFIWGSRTRIREEQLARYIQEGFVVVAIDYRLAPETKLPAILDDLKDAYEWIRKSGPILFQADPDRVIVVGHSAGGYLALMGGVVLTPPPLALVSFYGYGDISGDWCNQPDVNYSREPAVSESAARGAISSAIITEASHSKRWPFYLYCRQRGSWAREVLGEQADVGRFCPVRHVTKAFPPTLLLHGDCDTDVPYEQSVKMAEALRSQAVPCEFITLTNHGHAFDSAGDGMRDPLVADAFERVIRFVKDRAGRQASVIAPRSVSQFNEMAHRAIETNAQASGVEPSKTEGKPK